MNKSLVIGVLSSITLVGCYAPSNTRINHTTNNYSGVMKTATEDVGTDDSDTRPAFQRKVDEVMGNVEQKVTEHSHVMMVDPEVVAAFNKTDASAPVEADDTDAGDGWNSIDSAPWNQLIKLRGEALDGKIYEIAGLRQLGINNGKWSMPNGEVFAAHYHDPQYWERF